jgi:hypothetical protein
MRRVIRLPLVVLGFVLAGVGTAANGQVVITRDTLVYYHVPQQLRYHQAGPNETLCVWLSPPRPKPWWLTSVRFVAGDSASWDTVRGCVRLVPRYASGGKSLTDLGSIARSFVFLTGGQGETAVASFNRLPPADTAHDFAVCWTSRRMGRVWPIDDTASWSPPRSYRVWHDSGRIVAPLAGDVAVVGVFTLSETVQMRDVEVGAIVAPLGRLTQGTAVAPRATVRNNGSDVASFPVLFRIGSSYADSVSVSGLAPGMSTIINFRDWAAATIGTFVVKCSTMLPADSVRKNDWKMDTVVVVPPDTGSFTIELRCTDGTADCDLYLLLPRTQGDTLVDTVAWFNRQARGCMLDVDDTKGYGPEKVQGPIGSAMPDSARVWVNYYGPSNGVQTKAKVLFYRDQTLVKETSWYALSYPNWWNVGPVNLRNGTPNFLTRRSVFKSIESFRRLKQ